MKEKFKTLQDVFDLYTEKNLFHMMGQGHFDGLESPIGVGKEANTFSAIRKGKRVLVKIYRLQTCDFNRMFENLRTDPRFDGLKRKRRKVVFAWAKREASNLSKLGKMGMHTPKLIAHRDNIVVMQFIGDDGPAPQVVSQKPKKPKEFLKRLIVQMKAMHKAGMVHGDLSPFNLLNWNEKPYIIDVSQTTSFQNPNAEDLLERDLRVMAAFFTKIGVKLT
ncbi:MAG: RIO1 family regulatory kinase/ATPase, partial [Candidatus Woesearchaeota archaeon]|nr:RIO1 family regulatory kinase/ATPase [Candidatus Woesearchaeota archaeon]